MSVQQKADAWIGRLSGLAGLWALVPTAAVAALMAYLSTGVAWIAQLGAFGWVLTGFLTFVLGSWASLKLAQARLTRVEAKARERIGGESSAFDPMARVYENKRLYLRDLAPLGRREVIGKKFVNCEIIGPGTVVLGLRSSEERPFPQLKDTATFDVDAVEVDPTTRSHFGIAFIDCDMDGCKLYHMTALFFERTNPTLSWITKQNQPLLEDASIGKS